MKKGEKALLTITPEYGYGEQGSPPTIPPNATLQFEVELLSWNSVKDITPSKDGGIIKTVIAEGDGWAMPKDNDEVLGGQPLNSSSLLASLQSNRLGHPGDPHCCQFSFFAVGPRRHHVASTHVRDLTVYMTATASCL